MISIVLALMLLAAPVKDNSTAARLDYSRCLTAFLKTSLKSDIAPEAFDTAVAAACTPTEQAFKRALIASDRARGFSLASSEEGAVLQIDDILLNTKELFRAYRSTNSLPSD